MQEMSTWDQSGMPYWTHVMALLAEKVNAPDPKKLAALGEPQLLSSLRSPGRFIGHAEALSGLSRAEGSSAG